MKVYRAALHVPHALVVVVCLIGMPGTYETYGQVKSVTVTGTDLSPAFSPGNTTPIVSLSFSSIGGKPKIASITVTRTGSATDTDVPTVSLYEDTNRDGVPDGAAIASASFSAGIATMTGMINTALSTTTNWLVAYTLSATADANHSAGCQIGGGGIVGSGGTVVTFSGITTGDHTLPVKLVDFSAAIEDEVIYIRWTTASENNNAYFILERADQDQQHFVSIAQVPGQGNKTSNTEYEYADQRVNEGTIYRYRLFDVDYNGNQFLHSMISIAYSADARPQGYALKQNFPNPFNASTFISYELPEETQVELSIINSGGREIATLVDATESAGYKTIVWDGKDHRGHIVSSGTYFFKLQTNKYVEYKKLLFIK